MLKTISNMELLEEDLEKLKAKLQLIRNKVIEDEADLGEQVKSLSGTVEKLRVELNLNIVQMADLAEANNKLELHIEEITAAAKQAKQENDSFALQQLRIEYNQAKITLEDQSAEIARLKQDLETRNSQLVEKEKDILDLHGEIEELMQQSDAEAKDRVSMKFRNSFRPGRDDDDFEDSKKLLASQNQELKDQLVNLTEESETAQSQILSLKLEVKKLNQQLFGVSSYVQQGRASVDREFLSSEHFDFRGTDMMRQYREVEESLSSLQGEQDNPYIVGDDSDKLFNRDSIVNQPETVGEKVVERIVEVPVEKIVERVVEVPIEVEKVVERVVERIVEVKVEVPVPQTGPSERDIEDRLKQAFEKDLNEVKSQLETSKAERTTKEIQASRLKESLEKAKQELEAEKKLRLQAEAKTQQPAPVDFLKNPYDDDEEEPASSVPIEGLKIELEILKSKLEQVRREFDHYKAKNPPTSPVRSARSSFQPNPKQPGQIVPAELQVSRTHIPTNDISKSSIFINKEEEIETVLRTVQIDKPSIHESQDFDHPKTAARNKPAEQKKPTADLGSSIITKEQAEERKKILERAEMNMSSLMKSSLGQSSIGGARSDKNDPEFQLKRALKEYNVLQIRIKELKKKHLEVAEKHEAALKELQACKDAKAEPRLLQEAEDRLKQLLEEKEKHLSEYRGTADIEAQLRKKLMDLIAQVEEAEKKKLESDRTQATKNALSQSKLALDSPAMLEPLADANPADAAQGTDKRASQPAPQQPIRRTSETVSLEPALNLQPKQVQPKSTPQPAPKPAEPPTKEELEAKLKSKKSMNDKLSSHS